MPKIWNAHDKANQPPRDAVLVDRRTKWGNPFVMHSESQRNAVCEKFEAYIEAHPELKPAIREELQGKDLVCWCAPKRCHAKTLMRIANEL
jgi:hypothetical protein